MRDRFFKTSAITAAAIGALVALLASQTSAQDPAASATTLKNPWGEPDLQGIWTSESDTPL
jgi:uncharacterized membrane protein